MPTQKQFCSPKFLLIYSKCWEKTVSN